MARKINKKTITAAVGTKPLITVDPSLPSFDDHPYFAKKAAAARQVIKKVGLPRQASKTTGTK